MNVIVAVATCLLGMLGICTAVGLGGACNDANKCTTTGQTCHRQYENCVFYGTCQWEQKYNTDPCVDSNQCLGGGATCVNNTCACASGTAYNTVLKRCTNQKEYGKTCTASPECYQNGTAAECNSNVCKCKSGYIWDSTTYECRHPYPTEPCSTAAGSPNCASPLSPVLGSGIVLATCSSTSCICPSGSTPKAYSQVDTAYKACFTVTTMVADGATCTTSNQCNSGRCENCPGTTAHKICIIPENGAGTPIAGLAGWVAMTTLLLLAL